MCGSYDVDVTSLTPTPTPPVKMTIFHGNLAGVRSLSRCLNQVGLVITILKGVASIARIRIFRPKIVSEQGLLKTLVSETYLGISSYLQRIDTDVDVF